METLLTVAVALLVLVIAKFIWDRYQSQQTWQRLGIPGPKNSSLIFGNFREIMTKGTFEAIGKWTKTYGKVFGYYQGGVPVLVTADPDMAKEVLIKQFDTFMERRQIADNTEVPMNNLVEQSGEQWKRVRALSTPTFSAKRMKQMSPLIHQSVEKLMALLQNRAEKGDAFDIYADVQRLTLDVIASSVFSYDTDVFNKDDNVFLKHLHRVFRNFDTASADLQVKIEVLIATLFPGILSVLRLLNPRAATIQLKWFLDLAKTMIKDRLDTKENRIDYIQLLLTYGKKNIPGDTSGTDTEDDEDDETRKTRKELKQRAKAKEMTMEEMQGSVAVFLVAGYETTATTLAYLSYYLALNPEIQAKLQQEIDEHFPNIRVKPVNYETVQELPYLDMAFCETSRLASIGHIGLIRLCNRDTDVCGYHIPKDCKVHVNMIAIHNDPELWGPEPVDQFVPDRFSKERKSNRHPMAYLPFGGGPRNCIGMRFAILEAKMAIITMLKRFTIEKCPETQLTLRSGGIHGPSGGMFVKLIERQ